MTDYVSITFVQHCVFTCCLGQPSTLNKYQVPVLNVIVINYNETLRFTKIYSTISGIIVYCSLVWELFWVRSCLSDATSSNNVWSDI